jgi:hypothetical protein
VREVIRSSSNAALLERAAGFVSRFQGEILVLAATRSAADDFVRSGPCLAKAV